MKSKNKLYESKPERWSSDPDKSVSYKFTFQNIVMEPGTKFKIKGEHTIFIFDCLVHHIVKDIVWIECQEDKGGFRSFYPSKISKIIVPKKPRRKDV